jgi:hypothetical protein
MALTDDAARRLLKVKIARFRLKIAKLRAKRVQALLRMAKAQEPRSDTPITARGPSGATP